LKKFAIKNFFERGTKLQGSNLAQDKGEIEDNWKFNGQIRVNLYKSKTKDHNDKKFWNSGLVLKLGRGKLHEIKSLRSIRDVIKRNQKS
jgi:hypothetical protein